MYVPHLPHNRTPDLTRQLAAHRRRQLASWQERLSQFQRIRPRDDDERIAQMEALELMKQARP